MNSTLDPHLGGRHVYLNSKVGEWTAVRLYPGAVVYDGWLFGWYTWIYDEDLYEEYEEDMEELIEEMRAELYG